MTSNRAPSDWYPLFPNPVVAKSLLDRLIDTSHQVIMNGLSYRPGKRPKNPTELPGWPPATPETRSCAREARLLSRGRPNPTVVFAVAAEALALARLCDRVPGPLPTRTRGSRYSVAQDCPGWMPRSSARVRSVRVPWPGRWAFAASTSWGL
ncbi:hypothetical protein [Streptomyces sp. NPDC059631]|uniref:hypothetical protein n=1 Tax=unclassified Streptomyces TaxID=2593676 RepID=UPI00369083AF